MNHVTHTSEQWARYATSRNSLMMSYSQAKQTLENRLSSKADKEVALRVIRRIEADARIAPAYQTPGYNKNTS